MTETLTTSNPKKFYEGPWIVLPGKLSDYNGLLGLGKIIVNGPALILKCPGCHRLQFVARKVTGSDEYPSVEDPIQCAGKKCKCETTFRIISGKTKKITK